MNLDDDLDGPITLDAHPMRGFLAGMAVAGAVTSALVAYVVDWVIRRIENGGAA